MIKKIILLLVMACLAAVTFGPVTAQAQTELTVTKDTVEINFPLTITFNLGAQSNNQITDIRLRYTVDQESFAQVTAEAYVAFAPATKVNAQYVLDMRKTGGMPPGTTMHYWWVITDAGGTHTETTPTALQFDDNRYDWKTSTEGLVTIYWYSGDNAFANEVMTAAQDALDKLAKDTGAVITRPVKMYVYASTQDLLGALMFPYEWTGAVTYSQFGAIAIGLAPSNIDWGRLAIAHELTHLVIHQVTMNPYNDLPRWLDEGLAVYNEGVVDVSFSTALYNAVNSDSLISVQSLDSPFSADATLAALSYGESFSIVDFLISTYGQDKMLQMLNIYSQGSSYDNALLTVYGFDTAELNSLWHDYVYKLYKPTKTTGVTA